MKYKETIVLKNGIECCLRNAIESDAEAIYDNFNLTHSQTDYLLSYPDENSFVMVEERNFLKEKYDSPYEIELIALVEGTVVGSASIKAVGDKYKIKHRAEFGISVAKAFWGVGIGRALMMACVKCAKEAGYVQLELHVVADNGNAVAMYKDVGFIEYGRNSKGYYSRNSGYQEIIYMSLEL